MKKYSFLIAKTLGFLTMGFVGFSQNSASEFEWTKQVVRGNYDEEYGILADEPPYIKRK